MFEAIFWVLLAAVAVYLLWTKVIKPRTNRTTRPPSESGGGGQNPDNTLIQ